MYNVDMLHIHYTFIIVQKKIHCTLLYTVQKEYMYLNNLLEYICTCTEEMYMNELVNVQSIFTSRNNLVNVPSTKDMYVHV